MENNANNKNGYRLLVIDLDDGSTVVNEEINALICGYASPNEDGTGGAASSIALASCNDTELNATLDAAEKAATEVKKHLASKKCSIDDFREFLAEIVKELGDIDKSE